MLRPQVSLGFRVHSGWAVMIACGTNGVLDRWRVELAADGMPIQPYHAAKLLPFPEAESLIRRCQQISLRLAIQAYERVPVQRVSAVCILASAARPLPDLASVLASHALIHTAEGEMYRDALRQAATHLGIAVVQAREKDVMAQLPAGIRRRIEQYAKILGPPWRQDEKLAAAAAYVAQVRERVPALDQAVEI